MDSLPCLTRRLVKELSWMALNPFWSFDVSSVWWNVTMITTVSNITVEMFSILPTEMQLQMYLKVGKKDSHLWELLLAGHGIATWVITHMLLVWSCERDIEQLSIGIYAYQSMNVRTPHYFFLKILTYNGKGKGHKTQKTNTAKTPLFLLEIAYVRAINSPGRKGALFSHLVGTRTVAYLGLQQVVT